MNLWLMDREPLIDLQEKIRAIREGKAANIVHGANVGSTRPVVSQIKDVNVMRIHDVIFARDDMLTEMLGLTSTEQYMEKLDGLLEEDKPILLDIDTPGGEISLMFEFAEMINDAGGQISAYTGGSAASAGFLLYEAVQGTKYAHTGSQLGSIGAVYSTTRNEENVIEIVSANAENKRGETGLQERANAAESKFHEALETYTGLTREQIIDRGNKGGMIFGSLAKDNGFVDVNTNFKGALAQINSGSAAPTEGKPMTDITQAEHEAAVKSAVEAALDAAKASADEKAVQAAKDEVNERYSTLMSHKNASNTKAVARLAKSNMSLEEAMEHMDDVAVAKEDDKSSNELSKEDIERIGSEAAAKAVAAARAASSDTTGLEVGAGESTELSDDEMALKLAEEDNKRRGAA